MYKAIGACIFVQPIAQAEEKTEFGLIIERPIDDYNSVEAIVLSIGAEAFKHYKECPVKIGDKIIMSRWSGNQVPGCSKDSEIIRAISDTQILGVEVNGNE